MNRYLTCMNCLKEFGRGLVIRIDGYLDRNYVRIESSANELTVDLYP